MKMLENLFHIWRGVCSDGNTWGAWGSEFVCSSGAATIVCSGGAGTIYFKIDTILELLKSPCGPSTAELLRWRMHVFTVDMSETHVREPQHSNRLERAPPTYQVLARLPAQVLSETLDRHDPAKLTEQAPCELGWFPLGVEARTETRCTPRCVWKRLSKTTVRRFGPY